MPEVVFHRSFRISQDKIGFEFPIRTIVCRNDYCDIRNELNRLMADDKFNGDSWHEPEVLCQMLTGLFYDYENAIRLYTETGLVGELLFPELKQLIENPQGNDVPEKSIAYLLLSEEKNSPKLPTHGNTDESGPWKLAARIRSLLGEAKYSSNGIELVTDEWQKRVTARIS